MYCLSCLKLWHLKVWLILFAQLGPERKHYIGILLSNTWVVPSSSSHTKENNVWWNYKTQASQGWSRFGDNIGGKVETKDTYIHLPTGECTITIQDVGLRVDGTPMIGPTCLSGRNVCYIF